MNDAEEALVERVVDLRAELAKTPSGDTTKQHRLRNEIQVLEMRIYLIRKKLGDTGP